MLLSLLLVNASAFVGVLLMSRYSVTLVDERGEATTRDGAWQERVVAPVRRGSADVYTRR